MSLSGNFQTFSISQMVSAGSRLLEGEECETDASRLCSSPQFDPNRWHAEIPSSNVLTPEEDDWMFDAEDGSGTMCTSRGVKDIGCLVILVLMLLFLL